jgi:heterodisulfide reductase subunit B
MKKQDTKKYSLFTGCLIPSKFPFIEKASRSVLEVLGIKLEELKEASCCPNQMAVKSSDEDLWYALAARNLCLAEKMENDILTLCNGCYDTLKTVNSRLKSDDKFRMKINKMLAEFDLEFRGTIDVKHIVQVLHDDVGQNAIEKKVIFPLKGIKIASFMGCHVKRPMDHMGFDDPNEPTYLDDLIKVMGGETVKYSEKDSCCAGGLSIGRKDDVVPAARRVLRSAMEDGASAIAVNCPFCFAQFFRSEKEILDIYFENIRFPVIYITELMGLTFGIPPSKLGMPMHIEMGTGGEKEFINRLLGEEADESFFSDEVTKEQLILCGKCKACVDDCPTAMTTSEYNPQEILNLVLEGKADEAAKREDVWFCMNCHECSQECPQGFGMVKLIIKLKNLAASKGIYPEAVGHRISELHESGYSFKMDEKIREELELPKIKLPEVAKLRKLMQEAEEDSEKGGD